MTRWGCVLAVLTLMAIFSLSCANISAESKVKCPKCGSVFTVNEGVEEYQKLRGGGGTGMK